MLIYLASFFVTAVVRQIVCMFVCLHVCFSVCLFAFTFVCLFACQMERVVSNLCGTPLRTFLPVFSHPWIVIMVGGPCLYRFVWLRSMCSGGAGGA